MINGTNNTFDTKTENGNVINNVGDISINSNGEINPLEVLREHVVGAEKSVRDNFLAFEKELSKNSPDKSAIRKYLEGFKETLSDTAAISGSIAALAKAVGLG